MDTKDKSMNLNKQNKVVMHNNLIKSKSNLSLAETKLLRLTIMQVVKDDKDFQTYSVSIKKLAELLNVHSKGFYGEIFTICDNLMSEKVYVCDGSPKHNWEIFHWCSSCKYKNGIVTIKLHDDLKPYLLELSEMYTQYILENILVLKSTFSIRIYELIIQEMKYQKVNADNEANIYLSVDVIRGVTGTENKYKNSYTMFEKRVVDAAVTEINEKLGYYVTYKKKKESRKVIGFFFNIKSKAYAMCLHLI